MPEKTEAQKRAQKAYMEKFAVARVRMEREKYDAVQAHAEARSESVNGFINRAIEETMERDKAAPGASGESIWEAMYISGIMIRNIRFWI